MHACKAGQTKIALAIIAHGADVSHSNIRGEFALLYAAQRNSVEIINALIAAKAHVDQCNVDARLPYSQQPPIVSMRL